MKFAALLLCSLPLFACATVVESTFVDGTFQSPQPALTFKVEGYNHIGTERYTREARDPTAGRAGEAYLVLGEKQYLARGDRNSLSSLIVVDTQSYPSEKRGFPQDPAQGGFSLMGYLRDPAPGTLGFKKKVLFSGNQARFLVRAATAGSDPSISGYPLSKGYALPGCVIVASWFMTGGTGNQYDARVDYIEGLPEDLLPCESWGGSDTLSEKQWRYLNNLEERLTRVFPYVDSGNTPLTKKPGSIESKLAELKKLFENGLITREEYDAKRKELLERY